MEALELTRRELIVALLGAPLAAACAPRPARRPPGMLHAQDRSLGHRLRDGLVPEPSQVRRVPIVIIGAGVSGLSAAWRLERAGVRDFEVLELEAEPGGTARAGHNAVTAYPWAAHYLPCPLPHARAVRALLLEMGVARESPDGELEYGEAQLVRAPQERVFVLDRWYEGQYPFAGASADDLAQLARFEEEVATLARYRDARGRRGFAVPMAHASDDPELLALDRMTLAEWCEARGFSSPRLRYYLEYGTRDDMGSTLEQTSAYAGLHYHAARATEAGSSRFLTWPEGNARLVMHMTRIAGTRLRTQVAVARLRLPAANALGENQPIELHTFDPRRGASERVLADHVVCAIPQAMIARLIEQPPEQVTAAARALQSGAWLVVNLSLRRRPRSKGFPECWDNVIYGSRSLGYVVATHQSDSADRARTVWTWYLPLTGDDPSEDRRKLLALDLDQCIDLVFADLGRAHPDLADCVERVDAFQWGHAMVRPRPGLFAGDLAALRKAAQRPIGRLSFAHTELSGLALFEEAQWHGIRAAEEVLRARGVATETLL